MAILETARLRLRAAHDGDVDRIIEALNDWAVAQWLVRPPFPYSKEDARAFISWSKEDHSKVFAGIFVIADQETDELLGCLSLEPTGDRAELGYWMRPAKQGLGYTNEAMGRVIDYAFDEMKLATIFATVDPANEASRRLLQRNGFALVGRRARDVPTRRGTRETLFFVQHSGLSKHRGAEG